MQQTCDAEVRRVLSNHYLDLESFSLHRHWPREDESFEQLGGSLDEVADKMVVRLGQITGIILENYSCLMPLSGGADSRTLAYSAKDKMHLATLTYSHRTNMITKFDCYVAKHLATDLGLEKNFRIFDAVKEIQDGKYSQSDQNRMRWDFCHRTGYQHAPTITELAVADILPETDFVLRGNILDLAKAFQWHRKSFDFDLNRGVSMLRIGGRSTEENLAYWGPEFLNWVDTLPALTRGRIYDFAYIEHVLPHALGGRLIGYNNASYLNPFNDRNLIKACIQVHPANRKNGDLNAALHRACGASDFLMTNQAKSDETARAETEALFA